MAKRDAVESKLSELSALREVSKGPEVLRTLSQALSAKVNLIVAKAAQIARHHSAGELADDLASAFARFMEKPDTTDKGCVAKTAIASALYEMALKMKRCMSQESTIFNPRQRGVNRWIPPPNCGESAPWDWCAWGIATC